MAGALKGLGLSVPCSGNRRARKGVDDVSSKAWSHPGVFVSFVFTSPHLMSCHGRNSVRYLLYLRRQNGLCSLLVAHEKS